MKSLCSYSADLWKHHCHFPCWQHGRRSRENRPVRRLSCCHFNHVQLKWTKLVTQLYDPMDCSLPAFSVHGILQARILEWLAMPSFRGSSWHRYQTHVSSVSYTASRFLTTEPLGKPLESYGRSQKMAPNSSQFGMHISLQSDLAAPLISRLLLHPLGFGLSLWLLWATMGEVKWEFLVYLSEGHVASSCSLGSIRPTMGQVTGPDVAEISHSSWCLQTYGWLPLTHQQKKLPPHLAAPSLIQIANPRIIN